MIQTIAFNDPSLVRLLRGGAVGALPTDTLYGLVAAAGQAAAVERLYALKQRVGKPGTVIAADTAQLRALGLPAQVLAVAEQWWPNPLCVIVAAPDSLHYVHQGKGSLAVRIPASPLLSELLRQTGPLLTSSANLSGQPAADGVDQAYDYFGDQLDFYVPDGGMAIGLPSTIIRIGPDGSPTLLRAGAVSVDGLDDSKKAP